MRIHRALVASAFVALGLGTSAMAQEQRYSDQPIGTQNTLSAPQSQSDMVTGRSSATDNMMQPGAANPAGQLGSHPEGSGSGIGGGAGR